MEIEHACLITMSADIMDSWMPLGIFPVALIIAILVTLGSAYYLLMNARTVAALFNRPQNELEPGPGRPIRSRTGLVVALTLFSLGTLMALALWSFSGTEEASNLVESHPEEVERR